jgi:hypothetical protein
VIRGGRIIGAEIRAKHAREEAQKPARDADRAEAESVVNPNGRPWRTVKHGSRMDAAYQCPPKRP